MSNKTEPHFLIFGAAGWIASHLFQLLSAQNQRVSTTTIRMEDRPLILSLLTTLQPPPTHVLNCAGATGRPNVDWCEDHRQATIRSNVIGTLNLADVCWELGIHCTVFATGCIYEYDAAHPMYSGIGYREDEVPNFSGSFYSVTKTHAEALLRSYPNVLVLRLRMPVSDDLHARSFVMKITRYERVVDVPNSNSILHDLLPAAVLLAEKGEVGVFNFTNPGVISHNEVLRLFERVVRPGFEWRNFSVEEQAGVIKAGRSNCQLDTAKLERRVRELSGGAMRVEEVHTAYEGVFRRMKKNIELFGPSGIEDCGLGVASGEVTGEGTGKPKGKGEDNGKENEHGTGNGTWTGKLRSIADHGVETV